MQQIYQREAISTAKSFSLANDQKILLHQISAANLEAELELIQVDLKRSSFTFAFIVLFVGLVLQEIFKYMADKINEWTDFQQSCYLEKRRFICMLKKWVFAGSPRSNRYLLSPHPKR